MGVTTSPVFLRRQEEVTRPSPNVQPRTEKRGQGLRTTEFNTKLNEVTPNKCFYDIKLS